MVTSIVVMVVRNVFLPCQLCPERIAQFHFTNGKTISHQWIENCNRCRWQFSVTWISSASSAALRDSGSGIFTSSGYFLSDFTPRSEKRGQETHVTAGFLTEAVSWKMFSVRLQIDGREWLSMSDLDKVFFPCKTHQWFGARSSYISPEGGFVL